jgi:tRNA (guanosine-2'-O-)-methyltransferase
MSSDAVSLYDLDLSEPVALVFGNEHSGVSEEALQLADGNFLIPQLGLIQSLNISVACAVSVYEVFRQGVEKGVFDNPTIQGEEMDKMLLDWVRR